MASNISLGIVIGAALSGSVGRSFGSLNSQASHLGRSLQNIRLGRTAAQDVHRLSEELGRLRTVQASTGTGNQALNRQIADTERQLERARQSVRRYGVNLGDLTNETNRLLHSEQRLGQQISRTNQLRANSARRSELGGQALGTIGTAVSFGLPVMGSVTQAGNFQADLRNTAITGGFAGTAQEKQLGNVIRAEAIRTGQNLGILNQGVSSLVAGGIQSVADLKAYVPVLGTAATAWNADMNDMSQLAISTKDQFGIVATDLKSALNIMGTAGKEGQFEVKDMAKWMPTLGAMLKSLGVTGQKGLAEASSWLQIARMGAGSTDAAGNNFQNFLSKITSPDTEKDFKKAGINLQQAQSKLMSQGYSAIESTLMIIQRYMEHQGPKAAADFKKVLESKDTAERTSALQRLNEANKLGDLFQDMQAMSFIRPALANMQKARDIRDKSLASAGSNVLDADFEKNLETYNVQFNRFKALGADVGVVIGNSLLPALNSIWEGISPVIKSFDTWASANPKVVSGIIGVAGGLIGLKVAALGIGFTKTIFSDVWVYGRIAAINLLSAAQWGLNAAVSFGLVPLGLIAGAVIAVGTAAFFIYKYWEPISTFFSEKFTQIGATVVEWKNNIIGAFESAAFAVMARWKPVVAWFTDKLDMIGKAWQWATTPISFGVVGNSQAGTRASLGTLGKSSATASLPAMASANSAPSGNGNISNVFHITQMPGEDSKDLAERVAKHISYKNAADKRGALHD